MRISDWSSDVCSSDLRGLPHGYVRIARAVRSSILLRGSGTGRVQAGARTKIGRASCRERVCPYVSISGVAVLCTKISVLLYAFYYYTQRRCLTLQICLHFTDKHVLDLCTCYIV